MNRFIGRVFKSVVEHNDSITFTEYNGNTLKMYHEQDCCENVTISQITGDLYDLVDSPILDASENTNSGNTEEDGHETWTFYKFRTRKGYVDITWHGESNGYYSESVYILGE